MRLVSICPSNTELIAYLGKTDWLVGVDDYSDWPENITDLPGVGPDLAIDMEKVTELKPDLVLASLSVPGMEKNIEALEAEKLPYIILNPDSLDDIAQNLAEVGEAIGLPLLGNQKAAEFRGELEKYQTLSSTIKTRPSLYWEWWPKPIFTPGNVNWLTEISELAGAYNIFRTEQKASIQTDWEDVLKRNPEHICMVWVGVKEEKMNPALIRKRPGWGDMSAVKNDAIHVLEESLYCRPSPRLLEGLSKLAHILHPDVFRG